MQLSLLKDNELYTCVLPEKQKGQYWITELDERNSERRVICVEGVDGRWMLKSNRHAVIQDSGAQKVKEVPLEAPCFYSVYLKRTDETAWLYAEPVSEDRRSFRTMLLPTDGKLLIGRTEQCDIQVASPFVSSAHAELHIAGRQITLADLTSANGTYVNGAKVRRVSLQPGDVVSIVGFKLIVGHGLIAINNPDGSVHCRSSALTPYSKPRPVAADDEDDIEDAADSSQQFYRSPRFKRDISRTEIKIDPPPAPDNQERMPLMLTLGPSMTMGMAAAFMAMFTLQNVLGSGGSIRNALPSLVMAAGMLTGTIVWPIATRRYEAKKRAKREKLRLRKYGEYLEQMSGRIEEECELQSRILRENYVTADECAQRIMHRRRNLWERTRGQNDFLHVRLGLGQLPLAADIRYPEKRFSLDDDELQEKLYALADEPKLLERVPITLSLADDWISGFIGDRVSTISMIKSVVLQLAALHSYEELRMAFIYNGHERETWEFVKWLPHVWHPDRSMRFLATDAGEVKELSSFFEKELARREHDDSRRDERTVAPHYIIFAIDRTLSAKADVLTMIGRNKSNHSISVVHLCDELRSLPSECSIVIELAGSMSKMYDKDDMTGKHTVFEPEMYTRKDEYPLAVSLANIRLASASASYVLPTMLTFLDMFEVSKVEHLNAMTRWKENDPTKSLETPIGIDTTGHMFKLDLHEKFHGPHGLIAGMTGSGKSEFIMTFILSLAVNYHPHEVAFILIDYKGGGMADAFASLPHLAGTITNLDGAAVRRSLISIQSELKRRQTIFSDTGKRLGMSNLDIYKYQKLYREGKVNEPLQHLFIISDEFAELKTQQPEFMEQLVSAARIGRSLGIHLILATQKPSGVVDDQIWSNSKFRICLKVQEKADSMDVIKRPDAAELSVTGRYYVQVGFNELFGLGQSAWGGAPYEPSDRLSTEREQVVTVIDNLGRIAKQVKLDKRGKTANPIKQLDAVNRYLASIAEDESIRVKPLWLEPIPAMITVDELKAKYAGEHGAGRWLEPVVGEADDPANQRRLVMTVPLGSEGHAVVYGAAGNGKTTFITTLIYSLICDYTPNDLHMYVLDFGSETLRMFATAPHVGDVLLSHETEKANNLFKMLHKEISRRKKRFSDYGGDYASYRKSGQTDEAAIVVIIHNYSAFSELHDDKDEALAYLTREGLKYGLYFVATAANTSAIRYRILQNFKQLFVLQLNDQTEYSGVLGNVEGVYPSKIKGRGIFKTDGVYEFQTAHALAEPDRVFEEMRRLSDKLNNDWQDAPAPPVPVLPAHVDAASLSDAIRRAPVHTVPVGIDKQSLAVSYYRLDQACVHLALGQTIEKPDFMQGLAEVLALQASGEVVALDADSRFYKQREYAYTYASGAPDIERQIASLFGTLVERNNTWKDAQERGDEPPEFAQIVCIIQGLSALTARLSEDTRDKLSVMLEKVKVEYRVSFIICDSVSAISSVGQEGWFKTNVSLNGGIWIGDGITDQYQLKLTRTGNDMYQPIGDRFGYVIVKGQAALVKLVASRHAEVEAEL